jgi:hypothetical protein
MPTIVWPGTPGETFENPTDQILYQLICSWSNTCGQCAQYHLAIAKWWGKFHHGCACISIPIYPGKKSKPYEDWHDIVENLSPDQQSKLVGTSNFKLIEQGVVKWEDVVTPTRIRLLREVVSRSKLTIDDLTKAGVDKGIAERAHLSVNTPQHILEQLHRQQLVKQIETLGIQPKTIKDALARGLTERIGLGGYRGGTGPGQGIPGVGPQPMPRTGPSRDDWIRLLLGWLMKPFRRQKASMGPVKNKS